MPVLSKCQDSSCGSLMIAGTADRSALISGCATVEATAAVMACDLSLRVGHDVVSGVEAKGEAPPAPSPQLAPTLTVTDEPEGIADSVDAELLAPAPDVATGAVLIFFAATKLAHAVSDDESREIAIETAH